jgi:hypothetical protein
MRMSALPVIPVPGGKGGQTVAGGMGSVLSTPGGMTMG